MVIFIGLLSFTYVWTSVYHVSFVLCVMNLKGDARILPGKLAVFWQFMSVGSAIKYLFLGYTNRIENNSINLHRNLRQSLKEHE